MSSPSRFAKPEIKVNKLDDLPNKGKGKPYTPDEIMKAMRDLYKLVHAQAKAYGGKNSKLLQAGIAETLLKNVANMEIASVLEEGLEDELDRAYLLCNQLQKRLGADEEAMKLLLDIVKHVNKALSIASKGLASRA